MISQHLAQLVVNRWLGEETSITEWLKNGKPDTIWTNEILEKAFFR
jgi:hypothetical protein